MERLPLSLGAWFAPLLLAGPAFGETIYVDDDATGANDGSSWADAYTRLDVALEAAEASDEIWLAEGTYLPSATGDRTESFFLQHGVAIYGAFQGWEASVAARRGSTEATILSGDLAGDDGPGFTNRSDNSVHVLEAAIFATTRLDRVTVRGGHADLPDHESGGGFYAFLGAAEVVGCIFTDNDALEQGGGAFCQGVDTFEDTLFIGNRAGEGGGGLAADTWETATPVVRRCRFVDNEVTGGTGGGLWFNGLDLVDCELVGNRAPTGAGLYTTSGGWGLTIVGNTATQAAGGAVVVWGPLRSSIVWGNTDPSGSGEAAQVSAPIGGVNESCVEGWTGALGGSRNIGGDPMFVDPIGPDGVPGTGDEDLALGPGSPCIDRGEAPYWGAPPTDLRGQPREIDALTCGENGVIDMGAIERQEVDGTTNYCAAAPSSLGVPATLSAPCERSLFLDDTLVLRASPVPDGVVVFVMSPEPGSSPAGNGVLCIGPGLVRLGQDVPSSGIAEVELDLRAPPASDHLVAGSTWFLQAMYRDTAAGGARFNLTDAASLEVRN